MRNMGNKQKPNKMVALYYNISVTVLNVIGLNISIKRRDCQGR